MHRPAAVAVVGGCLAVLSLAAAVTGLGLSWVSSWRGSREPASPLPAMAGLAVAAALALAAWGLVTGRLRRAVILALTAVAPLTLLAASGSSSDASGAVVPAFALWLALAYLLSRPMAAAWLDQGPQPQPQRPV